MYPGATQPQQQQGPYGPPQYGGRMPETADELRRNLHEMKFRNREAAVVAAQASPMQKFMQSYWFTGLLTGLAVFLLLYISNPLFVQETSGSDVNGGGGDTVAEKYTIAKPNMKRVAAWAILAALLTVFGPLVYQKVSAGQ